MTVATFNYCFTDVMEQEPSLSELQRRINFDPARFVDFAKKYLEKTDCCFCVKGEFKHKYESEEGRFLQEDPAGQGLNPYAYCANNPLIYTDPDGQFFFSWLFSAIPIIGTAVGAAIDTACWAGAAAGTGSTALSFASNVASGRSNDVGSLWGSFKNGFGAGFGASLCGSALGAVGLQANFGTGLLNETMAAGVNQGMGNMVLGSIGKDISQVRYGDLFAGGFATGAFAHVARTAYKNVTGFKKIDARPGDGVVPTGQKLAGTMPAAVEGFNNLFFPLGQKGIDPFFYEGGVFSKYCNLIPGLNAVAGLHDFWAGDPSAQDWLGTSASALLAAGITYSTFYSPY